MRFLASVRQRQPAHLNGSLSTSTKKRRALVICTHMRPGRVKRRSSYVMQPISGLHVASLIDPQRFDVRLYHEDWHGPFNPFQAEKYDLVFLTGLQPDFDRMRQLSYFFRRAGAVTRSFSRPRRAQEVANTPERCPHPSAAPLQPAERRASGGYGDACRTSSCRVLVDPRC